VIGLERAEIREAPLRASEFSVAALILYPGNINALLQQNFTQNALYLQRTCRQYSQGLSSFPTGRKFFFLDCFIQPIKTSGDIVGNRPNRSLFLFGLFSKCIH
jgi:hypothetical protein